MIVAPNCTWRIDKGRHRGRRVTLLTPAELAALPSSARLVSISGATRAKGRRISRDQRAGCTAFAREPQRRK
jgi:hypothetical protein